MYGLSSIAGRFLNYLLVPLHTFIFKDPKDYGVVTEFYAYVAFLNIAFTYGMETTFFRYTSLQENRKRVYDTAMAALVFTSLVFTAALIAFAHPIAAVLLHPDHPEYITWFALILGFDAVVAIPFARLRQENRPGKFALFKIISIAINVVFNVFFLVVCPYLLSKETFSSVHPFIQKIYEPQIGIGYIFISQLIANALTVGIFLPKYFLKGKWELNFSLLKQMLRYSWPLIIVGLAGMVNETLSRAMLKYLLPVDPEEAQRQLGIFGACYKMSVFMTAFVQAYRMAAEPFFFYESKQQSPQLTYAKTMNYFVITCCLIFLVVMLFMDVFRHFLGDASYYEGLKIVPVLLFANFFLGVYYNLTIWYKLTDKNRLGAVIAIIGAAITIVLNMWWIPVWGYLGSSWVTFICYATMMVISFFLGQKYFPVPYDLKRFFGYITLALILFFIGNMAHEQLAESPAIFNYLLSAALLGIFSLLVFLFETGRIQVFKPIR